MQFRTVAIMLVVAGLLGLTLLLLCGGEDAQPGGEVSEGGQPPVPAANERTSRATASRSKRRPQPPTPESFPVSEASPASDSSGLRVFVVDEVTGTAVSGADVAWGDYGLLESRM